MVLGGSVNRWDQAEGAVKIYRQVISNATDGNAQRDALRRSGDGKLAPHIKVYLLTDFCSHSKPTVGVDDKPTARFRLTIAKGIIK